MLKLVLNTFFSKIISAVTNLFVAILISKFSGADGKGETTILLANISIVLLVTNIFSGATIAFLFSKYNSKKIIETAVVSSLAITTISFFIFYYMSDNFFFSINCTLLSFIASLLSLFQNLLLSLNKIKIINLLNLIQSFFIFFLVLFGTYFFNNGVLYYTVGLYFAYCVSALLAMFLFYKLNNKSENKEIISFFQLFKIGVQNQMSHVFYLVIMRLSYYLLLWKSGMFSVGVFSNALIISEGIWLFSSSLATVQYSKIINSSLEDAVKITLSFCRLGLIINSVIILCVLIIPVNFFTFCFGKDFSQIKEIIIWLSPGIIIYNFAIIIGHYFSGIGQFKANTIANFIGFLACFIAVLFFINNFNVKLASLLHVIGYFTISFVLIYKFVTSNKIKLKSFFNFSDDFTYIKEMFNK